MAKVLVIDDDELICGLIASKLSNMGHNIQTARDGVAGLATASTQDVDVIILDHDMPMLDGMSVLTALKETPRLSGIPIVMLTADTQGIRKTSALDIGASAYLKKPVAIASLVETIEDVLAF